MVASIIVVGGFVALWLVANELEDPFGYDANDMPMLQYHEEFCAMLCALITSAWLPEDHWMVPQGKWVAPRTAGNAANAFFDAIHSKKQIKLDARHLRGVPHDSVLNRAKRANTRSSPLAALLGRRRRAGVAIPTIIDHGSTVARQGAEMELMAAVIQRATRARQKKRHAARAGAAGYPQAREQP